MVKPCDIILEDEPTGALDEENRNKILPFISVLKKYCISVLSYLTIMDGMLPSSTCGGK